MNIAFFLFTYPGIGGTETVSNLLAEWFTKKGGGNCCVIAWKRGEHKTANSLTDIFYLPDGNNIDSDANVEAILEYVTKKQIRVIINQGPFWKGTKRLHTAGCRLISVLHYAPSFRIDNNRNAIDRLYNNSEGKKLSYRIKTLVRHSFKDFFSKRDFYRIDAPFFREVLENSDAFVLLCPSYVTEWKNLLKLRDDRLLLSIHNPIIVPKVNGTIKTEKMKTLLFVGRLTAWDKRVDRLLYLWSELESKYKDWKLCVVGDGEERKNLMTLAKELQLERVEFVGYKDPRPYYRNADVLCMTSSSEGYPMVVLEAAIYGCPTIAYGVSSGIKEMIEDGGTGFVIKPFQKEEYLTKLRWLMDNQSEREAMGKNAYVRLSKYDIETIGKQWIALFNKIRVEQ